jgi:hypothetical protein
MAMGCGLEHLKWVFPASKGTFIAVVMLNASAIAPYVNELSMDMLKLIPMVTCFHAVYKKLTWARVVKEDESRYDKM